MNIEQVIEEVLNDATASDWLKWSLRSALNRDALDAANDSELLNMILSTRLHSIFNDECEVIAESDCVPL